MSVSTFMTRFHEEGIPQNVRAHLQSSCTQFVGGADATVCDHVARTMRRTRGNTADRARRARVRRRRQAIPQSAVPNPLHEEGTDATTPSLTKTDVHAAPIKRPRLERRDANESPNKKRVRLSSKKRAGSPSKRRRRSSAQSMARCPAETFVDPRDSVLRHNFDVMHQFKRRCFLIDGQAVLRGFIRRNECLLEGRRVVPGIVDLCASYYVDDEAGIFQIGHKLHRILKKAKRHSITMEMARALTDKYLESKGDQTAMWRETKSALFCSELVRLGYLVPAPPRTNGAGLSASRSSVTVYRIPMEKELEFSCSNN